MKFKEIIVFVVLMLFILAMLALTAWYLITNQQSKINNNPPLTIYGANEQMPTIGNNGIIETNSETSLRIINEYTTEFFTAKKNLLIMFGSWCSHCQEELEDIELIVDFYKNNKDVSVILIAHEYENTISDLKSLVEQNFNFGNTQVLIDLKRIIRKTLDPEASTVPISYVVDKKGNVLEKNDGAITLDIAKDMLK